VTAPDTSTTTFAAPTFATPPPFTAAAVRAGYDGAATRYAELFADPLLRDHPLERGLLAAFAELVHAADGGGGRPVADLGCGPGYVTAHLSSLVSCAGSPLRKKSVIRARLARRRVVPILGCMGTTRQRGQAGCGGRFLQRTSGAGH
jgi:hypothetical protein